MLHRLQRFALLFGALGSVLACGGAGNRSYADARGEVGADDAAAMDSLLAEAGLPASELRIVAVGEWAMKSGPEVVITGDRVTHLKLPARGLGSMASVAGLGALRVLDLSGNRIARIEGLGNAAALETLNLDYNALATLDGLADKPMLRAVYVSGNQLASLDGLRNLPALTIFAARGNQLRDAAPLAAFPTLKQVDLANNHLTAAPDLAGVAVTLDGTPILAAVTTPSPVVGAAPGASDRSTEGHPSPASVVAALPHGGAGDVTVSNTGVIRDATGGFRRAGTVTGLTGVGWVQLQSRRGSGGGDRRFVADITAAVAPLHVYAAAYPEGYTRHRVEAGATARIEGRLAQGVGGAFGLYLEAIGGPGAGARFDARSP